MAKKKQKKLHLVEAIDTGYYGEERRYAGEQFAMDEDTLFSKGKDGKRIIEDHEDEETGETVKVYKTASWVNLIKEDYDPYEAAEAEQEKTKKKKVRIGPQDSAFPPPPPLSMEPQSANPKGFAKTGAPVKATEAANLSKDKEAPQAKKVAVQEQHEPAKPTAGKDQSSDDVI